MNLVHCTCASLKSCQLHSQAQAEWAQRQAAGQANTASQEDKEFYEALATCTNCGYQEVVRRRFGKPVNFEPCSNCRCGSCLRGPRV